MAFLTGAIDKDNFKRFAELVTRSQITEFHATPFREGNYYVVNLRVSMDPETIIEALDQYNTKSHPNKERP